MNRLPIIPVLDILDGQVVQGIAGRRETYQPISSSIVSGSDPTEVLVALLQASRSRIAYIADLNGLMNGDIQTGVLKRLSGLVQNAAANLIVDAGIRCAADVDLLPPCQHIQIVLASECLQNVSALQAIIANHSERRFVFSFDFVDERFQTLIHEWQTQDILQIAEFVWNLGIRHWIVLDVKSVGMQRGPTASDRCRLLSNRFPDVELTSGGGIRSVEDFRDLRNAGVENVLISTALHNGSINLAESVR